VYTIINARLSANPDLSDLTGIFPSQPEVNPTLPYLVVTVTSFQQETFLDGLSSDAQYGFTVDIQGRNQSEVDTLCQAVRSSLHGWRGGSVQWCSLTNESFDRQELYHHAAQDYALVHAAGDWTALPDLTATIVASPNRVDIAACGQTLTLDCGGLSLNGETVGVGTGDKTYTHSQSLPATVWTVTHNLNKHPAVSVTDSAGNEVFGTVEYLTDDTLTVSFSVPFGGFAYCN
jgi:hypothetical protein